MVTVQMQLNNEQGTQFAYELGVFVLFIQQPSDYVSNGSEHMGFPLLWITCWRVGGGPVCSQCSELLMPKVERIL